MHLGMSGSFRVEDRRQRGRTAGRRGPARSRRLRMSSQATVFFNDPRRFGFMDLVPAGRLDAHPVLSRLGPEPLSAGFDGAALAPPAAGRRCR